ncbi:pectinesterase family protein, partial [Klebsiella pneumoniae]
MNGKLAPACCLFLSIILLLTWRSLSRVCLRLADAFGHGFLAQDRTIRNAAGPKGNQAVAQRSNSNKSVVYRCRVEGYKDTLYAENGLQFYVESNITGTVDFV